MKLFKSLLVILAFTLSIVLCVQGHIVPAIVLGSLASFALTHEYQPAYFHDNVLTNLLPDFYIALDVVSRELTGMVMSVARDSRADRVAIGQTARSIAAPANTAGKDITPAMSLPARADQTIGNKPITINKSRAFPFSWTGEEQYAVDQGPGYLTIEQGQIAQAIRAGVNEIEADLCTMAYKNACRAYGTAGTTPFATDLSDTANLRKILDDNGAPSSGRALVINTTAGVKVRTLTQLTKANEAATDGTLRQGTLLDVHGFAFKESAKIQTVTAGSMANATTTNAVLSLGQTVLPLATAGTGTVAIGDIITLANDTNKYVVTAVSFAGANPAAGDSITIAAPGLLVAQSAATRAITVVGTAARNIAFSNNAFLLATRLPARPKNDLAIAVETVTDPRTGISFELAAYPGYHMLTYEVGINWGCAALKPEHAAVLLG